jgi:hypothetical protein
VVFIVLICHPHPKKLDSEAAAPNLLLTSILVIIKYCSAALCICIAKVASI